MNIKITFHNMNHSDPLEAHARAKLHKIEDILKGQTDSAPFYIELWLKANKLHPHHSVELHVKTSLFSCNAHHEGPDLYVVLDTTIDKMITQIKKEKERLLDKIHKPITEKKKFFA